MPVPIYTPYYQTEYVLDDNNQPVTNGVWVEESSNDPDGNPFSWSVVPLGGGNYRFSFTPQVGGTYTLFASIATPTGVQVYEIEAEASGMMVLSGTGGTSLRDIRAMVARQLKDYRLVTASAGGINTVEDIFNLSENTDLFRGAEMLVVTGHPDNVGRRVKAVGSSFDYATVSFRPDLPQPIVAGDKLELFNFGRLPFRIADYDNAINDAIWNGYPQNRISMYMEVDDPMVGADGAVIPDPFVAISGVDWKEPNGEWRTMSPGRYVGDEGWSIDTARKMIMFGPYTPELRSKAMRIYGYMRAPKLSLDTDRTLTDVEWVIDQAVGSLMTSSLDQATFAIGQSRLNRADQLRGKMLVNADPNTVSLE